MKRKPVKSVAPIGVHEAGTKIEIHPRMPAIDGIFGLGSNVLIAAHSPHEHVREHLHDHLCHMHIRYGFELPRQSFQGISKAALQVMMMIKVDQRVDCNPVFVALGPGQEGICLKIAGQDVHWIQNKEAGQKATELFEGTGRKLPLGFRFQGFQTSSLDERQPRRYTREELQAAVGLGLRADQHFQATWIEPENKPIEPYDVVICLADDATDYHTFFRLEPTVSLSAC